MPSALLAPLIAISLVSDFLMAPALAMIPALPIFFVPLLGAAMGCTLAQGCLLAAWLVLRRQRGALTRFRIELVRNVRWVKQMLTRPSSAAGYNSRN